MDLQRIARCQLGSDTDPAGLFTKHRQSRYTVGRSASRSCSVELPSRTSKWLLDVRGDETRLHRIGTEDCQADGVPIRSRGTKRFNKSWRLPYKALGLEWGRWGAG